MKKVVQKTLNGADGPMTDIMDTHVIIKKDERNGTKEPPKPITVKLPLNELENILDSRIEINIPNGLPENEIDYKVKLELAKHYDDKYVKLTKTGINSIDKKIPSKSGTGQGKIDVIIFNYFNSGNIDVIVENKNLNVSQDSLSEAIYYANGLNKNSSVNCRVAIGFIPNVRVRVLVGSDWKELKINGNVVDYFFKPELLKLIYKYPNICEFNLQEDIDLFSQKDLHTIISQLKTLYRQIPDIQNNDNISINFTISFIALKMISDINGLGWSQYSKPQDIISALQEIRRDNELKKYIDIFEIKNKDDTIAFNFEKILDTIYTGERKDAESESESIIMKVHKKISHIPDRSLEIDLFGEVYECLANSKTKSSLGEYFTRRHIIHSIVRMFFTGDDIFRIISDKKKICDVACGTGGFLTESFKYLRELSDNKSNKYLSDLAKSVIFGYDINSGSIGRTRINMILAGDGFADIQCLDSLKNLNQRFDYILTNVPYGKGDYAIQGNDDETDIFIKENNVKRLEFNFLIKVVKSLNMGGKALVIIPDGILETPSLRSLREWLLKQCKVTTIISLPKFAFAPYTKEKTYVIFIEKRSRPLDSIESNILKNEMFYAYIVDNDGFANSDKRFETNLKDQSGKWLHNEFADWREENGKLHHSHIEDIYLAKEEDLKQKYLNEWDEEIRGKKYGYIQFTDILKDNIVSDDVVNANLVNQAIMMEYNNRQLLPDDLYMVLDNIIPMNAKGKPLKIKKGDYVTNDKELVEGMTDVLSVLGYYYKDDKFYDLSSQTTSYLLNLLPEKYFRNPIPKQITLDELDMEYMKVRTDVMNMLQTWSKVNEESP